jgi:hypothetical protein
LQSLFWAHLHNPLLQTSLPGQVPALQVLMQTPGQDGSGELGAQAKLAGQELGRVQLQVTPQTARVSVPAPTEKERHWLVPAGHRLKS